MNTTEIIGKLQLHDCPTDSELELTTLVLSLAEIVNEQQGRIEKLETKIRTSDILPYWITKGDQK